jgi:hypothetical protein
MHRQIFDIKRQIINLENTDIMIQCYEKLGCTAVLEREDVIYKGLLVRNNYLHIIR